MINGNPRSAGACRSASGLAGRLSVEHHSRMRQSGHTGNRNAEMHHPTLAHGHGERLSKVASAFNCVSFYD